MSTVVVVGASVAGVRCVQALRLAGFDGHVILVGDEPDIPYDKPPLSKQYLAGSFDAERLTLLSRAAAHKAGVDLRLGAGAESLDVAGHRVRMDDGSVLSYDTCVIATGASARPSPWATSSGVHVIRTRGDSDALRGALSAGGPVVVVGGGFIGAEAASTARGFGCDVTVVDPLKLPIARVVGDEVGDLLGGVHARNGVTTRFGVGVAGITGEQGALEVRLTDGEVLAAATVVVGIGAVPNDGWLASSGLLIADGVVCDEYCRAVDAPDVYAAGDVARWQHRRHGSSMRVEHWTNAVEQAALVARNIAATEALQAYEPVEYVWSDQYDWKIQMAGSPALATEVRLTGDLDAGAGRFAALYGDENGRLSGAVTVNWPRGLVECRKMLGSDFSLDGAVAAIGRLYPVAGPRQEHDAAR